ncbi:MAG: RdgB/HAM1 family non-canonical purine NTP pyrophosphatase [Planctomycetota bacterium]|nr:RdgB/HAM1 family non-canonical purine NTP pyrophosphatase [Planctomycetota bacterium]
MLLVGTGNLHKLEEISSVLNDLAVRTVGIEHLPPCEEVEETGVTFKENALIKAVYFSRMAAGLDPSERPRWVIADDSGLCVDALDGAPGVYSARFAGENCTFADNNRKLLDALEGVEAAKRTAQFVCVICCVPVLEDASVEPEALFYSEGICPGHIALDEAGTGGFGYDPVFIEASTGRTFAELEAEQKNRLSHRGQALEHFRGKFASLTGS